MVRGISSRGASYDGEIVSVLGELQRDRALALRVLVVSTDSMLYFERREDLLQGDRTIFTLHKQSCRVAPAAGAPSLENGEYEVPISDSVNEVYYGEVSPETLLWRRSPTF